jgi:hypothetical protein
MFDACVDEFVWLVLPEFYQQGLFVCVDGSVDGFKDR